VPKFCLRVVIVTCIVGAAAMMGTSLAQASSEMSMCFRERSVLPEWPKDFGPPENIVQGCRHHGYSAVLGPDGLIWCFTVNNDPDEASSGKTTSIGFTRVTRLFLTDSVTEVARLAGDLVDIEVSAGYDRVVVFWAEKLDNEYQLYSREIAVDPSTLPQEKEIFEQSTSSQEELILSHKPRLGEKVHLLTVKSVVTDVAVAVSGEKNIYGWIDQEQGRPAVFLTVFDRAYGKYGFGEAEPKRMRISSLKVSASTLRLSPAPHGAWITWVQSKDTIYCMMFRAYVNGKLYPELEVAETSAKENYGVVALGASQKTCHLVFTKGRILRGNVANPVVTYGRVTRDGKWIVKPLNISQGEGYAVTPSFAGYADKLVFCWSDNRQGRLGVHWAEFEEQKLAESQPRPLKYGAVSYSKKECLSPSIFAFPDGTKTILYQVFSGDSRILVKGVSTLNPKPPDWLYYLGLDREHPIQNAIFKIVSALGASLTITCLSIPSIAFGFILTLIADRLKVFSQSNTGRLLRLGFLFGSIFLLKSQNKWYYLFAPILPSGLAWVSFTIAFIMSVVFIYHFKIGFSGILPAFLGGVIFVFFDTLFSLVQKGVGYF